MGSLYIVLCLGTLIDRDIVSSIMAYVVLSRPDDLILRVIEEFVPMSYPASSSRNHEENREHVGGETHCFVDDSGVEINVRVQFPLDKVRVTQSNPLQFNCDFNQFLFSSNLEHLLSHFFYKFGPRVIIFVHSMTETIEKSFSVLNVLNKLGNVGLFTNRLKHSQDCLIGSSMFGAVESSCSTCDSSVDIDSR